MKVKTFKYRHLGIEFTSSKKEHINLEMFLSNHKSETTDELFWRLRYHYGFKLFPKERVLWYYNNLKVESDKLKLEKQNFNTKMLDYWIKYANDYFSCDYEKDQDEYRKQYYEEHKIKIPYEEFLKKLDGCWCNLISLYDFSNGSYYRPLKSRKLLDIEDRDLKENFEINMKHFKSLDKKEFSKQVENFLVRYPDFREIKTLNEVQHSVPGYYVLVLDEYKQVYIGQAHNLYGRILQHFKISKKRDRRIFGDVKISKISIDSFGPFDITRIYLSESVTLDEISHEDELIEFFDNKFVTNRVQGGELPLGLDSAKRKEISD